MRLRIFLLISIILNIIVSPTYATPIAIGVNGAYEANFSNGGADIAFISEYFNRDKYPNSGASIYIKTAILETGVYLPEKEYHWQFSWKDPSGVSYTTSYTYNPALDCIINDFTGTPYCNVSASAMGTYRIYEMIITINQQCIPEEQTYSISASMDASINAEWSYNPTPFRVGAPNIELSKEVISPKIRTGHTLHQEAIEPGTTTVTATVLDAYGCNVPISGALVDIKNTLPDDSAGHYHFSEGDDGTGKYTSITNPSPTIKSDISFSALSDESGKVTAQYSAGSLGVLENVVATAYNRENTDWPFTNNEQLQTSSTELKIRVPGLVHLNREGITYGLRGSGSTLDLNHNHSATERNSHWVTPYTYAKAQQLSDFWSVIDPDGLPLCYNDGSLEYGGTFDNPNNAPNYRAHYYHQVGKDLDVNAFGCLGYARFKEFNQQGSLVPIMMTYDGRTQTKQATLDGLAKKLQGQPYPEASIHYRFLQ